MTRSLARELRKAQTPAEQFLWERLRGRQLSSLKFRRQFPISIFVADFCCWELKLVVEVDGEVHSTRQQMAHDENRDFYLRSLGYRVIRFSNDEVLRQTDSVLQSISAVAADLTPRPPLPSPYPPPPGEGEPPPIL